MINQTSDDWVKQSVFASPIYSIYKPEFLAVTNQVADEFIEKRQSNAELNSNYPAYMTENLDYDERMFAFGGYVSQTAWNILEDQGYKVRNLRTSISEMWCQEHHKHSMMEQHTHGNGAQIVGFYFLNAPANCSRAIFHHPSPAKVQINLPQENVDNLTDSSVMMNIAPAPGLMVFSNSWVPHSFSRNEADEPLKFIHFNINVSEVFEHASPPSAEVI